MTKKAPCKGCEDRHPGCHAECESYKEWKAEHDEENARRRADGEEWRSYFAARKHSMRKKDLKR